MSLSSLGKALSELSSRLDMEFEVGTFGPMYFLRYGDVVVSFMEGQSLLSGPDFVRYLAAPVIKKDDEIFLPVYDVLDTLGLTYEVEKDVVVFITCVVKNIRVEEEMVEIAYKGEPLFALNVEGRFIEILLTGPAIVLSSVSLPDGVKIEKGYNDLEKITVELEHPVSEFEQRLDGSVYRIMYSVKEPSFKRIVLKTDGEHPELKQVFVKTLMNFGFSILDKPAGTEDEVELVLIRSRYPSVLYEPQAREHQGYFHREAVLSKRLAEKLATELSWTFEPLYLTLIDPGIIAVALAWPFDDLERVAEAVGRCIVEF
ncbi:MAG: hypothetical protein PWP37_1676 [Thermotogota bacterium]|nr:hypothetical protein [Thermotogota bacterium]MDK2865484.1 hypothetical protein [Thermotogota bacterium]